MTRKLSFILLLLVLPACHRTPTRRYHFTGHVIAVDAQAQSAIIDGDKIPGFMDAMAMSYKINPASVLKQLTPGDAISADVVVQSDPNTPDTPTDYWLENIKVTNQSSGPPANSPTAVHMPQPGDEVPNFALTDENGHHISLHEYRHKVLFVTFIYTRCPFPDFCPRMSSNFAEIYKQMSTNPALDKARLLSISFDPAHDTPKVLREYAFSVIHSRDADVFRRWEFAAPRAADLPKIADFFALTIKPEGGLITHNLSTAVIGPDGKIISWYHGSDWQISDLIKDATTASVRQ